MLKHIWNKLIEYFYNMKLKRKLLVAFFSLIIIPLGIFTIISNERVSNAIESLVKYSSIHSFEQAEAFLSYKIKKMYDVSNVITTDKKTVEILSKSLYATDLIDQFINQLDLSMYLTSFQNDDEIFKVNLYVNDSCFYANENKNIYGFAKLETSNWYNSFIKNRKNVRSF